MEENIINLYEANRGKASVVNRILIENMKVQKLRNQVIEYICEIALYMEEEDIESFKKVIEKGLEFEDSRKTIQEKWMLLTNNCKKGIKLISSLAKDPEIKKEMTKNPELIFRYSNWDSFFVLLTTLDNIDDGNIIASSLQQGFIETAIEYREQKVLAEIILRNTLISDEEKEQYIRKMIEKTEWVEDIPDIIEICKDTSVNSIYDEHREIMNLYEVSKNNVLQDHRLLRLIIGEIIKSGKEEEINAIVQACGDCSKIKSDGNRMS